MYTLWNNLANSKCQTNPVAKGDSFIFADLPKLQRSDAVKYVLPTMQTKRTNIIVGQRAATVRIQRNKRAGERWTK